MKKNCIAKKFQGKLALQGKKIGQSNLTHLKFVYECN